MYVLMLVGVMVKDQREGETTIVIIIFWSYLNNLENGDLHQHYSKKT